MAFVNLLPSHLEKIRRHERKKMAGATGTPQPLGGFPVFWAVPAAAGLFIVILGAQFMILGANKKKADALDRQIEGIKQGYQKITDLSKEENSLREIISSLQKHSLGEDAFSGKFYIIAKLLPAQAWLTNITVDTKETKEFRRAPADKKEAAPQEITRELTIKGCAVSSIANEIIASITRYVDVLKKDETFSKDFSDIKLGPLQSERKGNFTVMNFVIYCKSVKYL